MARSEAIDDLMRKINRNCAGKGSCADFCDGNGDTLAWATGTRVHASDHAIALFCILYGCVPGFLYSDTFTVHFVV